MLCRCATGTCRRDENVRTRAFQFKARDLNVIARPDRAIGLPAYDRAFHPAVYRAFAHRDSPLGNST